MPAYRPLSMSLAAALIVAMVASAAVASSTAGVSAMQGASAQQLFEAGKHSEAVQAVQAARDAGNEAPDQTFIAAQAHLRAGSADAARDEFSRLQNHDNAAWRLIGESALDLLDHNGAAAIESAQEAAAVDGENPWAQYQLGLAAANQGDFGTSARAFERALELKGDLAYAHYYAGQALQRQKQHGKAAEHYEAFLQQAPEAPERIAIVAIMRTLR